MNVELVSVRTSDGIRLDGALQHADRVVSSNEIPFDAIILLSGVGSNFYGSTLIESLAATFTKRGITALRVNTRGHDGVCTVSSPTGGKLQGAAYEIVDDCRYDIEAWIEHLLQQGHKRVALLGHSLGAVKVLYSQALQPHAAINQIIAISPPSLSHDRFVSGDTAASFQSSMEEAEQLCGEGRPEMLFQATFPFSMILSAGTYVDKYGPTSRYDFLRITDRITTPTLFTYGEVELQHGGVAFDNLPAAIREAAWGTSPNVLVVPSANHFYTECHSTLALLLTRTLF